MGIRVLETLDDLDLGSEGDLGADLEAGALVCLPGRVLVMASSWAWTSSAMLLELLLSPQLPAGPAGCR